MESAGLLYVWVVNHFKMNAGCIDHFYNNVAIEILLKACKFK